MAQKVHACIVLDRSGSMESCRSDAIGAVNSYLRRLKEDTETDAKVSLIIFDSESIDTLRDRAPAGSCADLRPDEYQPRASTPLLDAVGRGVALLDKKSEAGERRVLAVMTDGLENASREHTRETIKALLERKQKDEGWLVLYLGAGHDAWAQAGAMGFAAGNVAQFSLRRMDATSAKMYARQKRYVAAQDAVQEAQEGGFTAEERAEMNESEANKDTKKGR